MQSQFDTALPTIDEPHTYHRKNISQNCDELMEVNIDERENELLQYIDYAVFEPDQTQS
jgi:hypothetical protein